MNKTNGGNQICRICGKHYHKHELFPAELVRPALASKIQMVHPNWVPEGFICLTDLNHFRGKYLESVLMDEMGEISSLEKRVAESMLKQETLSQDILLETNKELTFGDQLADKIATVGGSWGFILGFCGFLVLWMLSNSFLLLTRAFDPFPYILLNLVLSTLAAVQAPVIMMSQRRQEQRDRFRAESDFKVNLKAELEIRHLHEKLDHLLTSQWQRLIEIQAIQFELMNELKAGQK